VITGAYRVIRGGYRVIRGGYRGGEEFSQFI